MMTDDHKGYAATPKADLEDHIMNPCTAKNEAEWWASREIERLRERLADVSDDNQRMRQSIKEYVSNSTRITNDMLREMYERECGDD